MKDICLEFNLGNFISEEIIDTGLTNILYKVKTDKDTYVIKIIAKEKEKQLEYGETISSLVNSCGVNTICALKFNDHYVQNYASKSFLIYKWSNGIILKSKELDLKHMEILGSCLAKIHSIKINEEYQKESTKIDFSYYLNLVKDISDEWALFFKENYDKLISIYDNVYENYIKLNDISYVHKDINRKNILWEGYTPYLIDFETATIGKSSVELFSSAWFLTEDFKEDKLKVFLKSYLDNKSLNDDYRTAIDAGIIEEINWLEFSLKRALKLNIEDDREVSLGINSIKGSLTEIINYYNKREIVLKIMDEFNY